MLPETALFSEPKIKVSEMASGAVLCAAALINFAFVFVTGSDFIRFVSFREIYHNITGETTRCHDSVAWSSALCDPRVLGSLFGDLCLVGLFTLQHSFLAWTPVKQVCERSLGAMSRSLYCFTTALTLQVLMRCWQPVRDAPCLWAVRTAPWSVWFPLLCFSLHFVCWALICSILIIFDYPELMGIKQVYYKCIGRGDPGCDWASGAQRLRSHLRHPVCVELLLVLWVLPALTLDRLVLAVALSSYLLLGHSLDKQDLAYVCARFKTRVQKQ